MKKLIYGVGINNSNYVVRPAIDGKTVLCPFYQTWYNMFSRCYSDKYQTTRQTYIGCSVIKEWHLFMNFRAWMMFQDWQGNELDKDIIEPGNKIYSPNSCTFVLPELNHLLGNSAASRGPSPQGVCWSESRKKFVAKCRAGGKSLQIGRYNTSEDASRAYREFKHAHVIKIANQQSNIRIKNGLLKHAELILLGENQ